MLIEQCHMSGTVLSNYDINKADKVFPSLIYILMCMCGWAYNKSWSNK